MLEKKFENTSLERIIEASLIYMCACPAQVARAILELRNLYDYQQNCLNSNPLNAEVHALIAQTVTKNHREMEETLDKILTLEGWDRETFEMPKGLRALRDKLISEI